ncbi:CD209 antigen-like protein 2 [Biomphalaria glabrata]|nr:CD209 antigen-like protein 2 [Biomphalaria glabrata]
MNAYKAALYADRLKQSSQTVKPLVPMTSQETDPIDKHMFQTACMTSITANTLLENKNSILYQQSPEFELARLEAGMKCEPVSVYPEKDEDFWEVETFTSAFNQLPTSNKVLLFVALGLVLLTILMLPVLIGTVSFGHELEARLDKEIQDERELLDIGHQLEATLNNLLKVIQDSFLRDSLVADLKLKTNDTCFCLYNQQISWNDARQFCLKLGTGVHLREIYSQDDDSLMPLFENTNLTQGIWLGGSNLMNQSVWLWDYTRTPISQWDINPSIQWDLSVGSKQCLGVFKGDNANYKLNGVECEDKKSFLCSAKLVDSACVC